MVRPPGWLVGIVAGIAALEFLGIDFALFASGGGILFAAFGAFWFGAGVSALVDPPHASRNAVIVAASILIGVVLIVGLATMRAAPPGTSRGGPNVYPPGGANQP